MDKINISALKEAYNRGENITLLLRNSGNPDSIDTNSSHAIEIAYDLQAGTYIERSTTNQTELKRYASEIYSLCSEHITEGDSILDCGTGELTTLSALSHHLPTNVSLLAFDISLSRVRKGKNHTELAMRQDLRSSLQVFVGEMNEIPVPSKSIDIVFTSHALEPNYGMEQTLISEILRVARKKAILFEPSYEHGSMEVKSRMQRLGYIRDLPSHINAAGGKLVSIEPLPNPSNPLNPTYCYIIEPEEIADYQAENASTPFACPISGKLLSRKSNYWWSKDGGYCYPEIEGIPCLRASHAILMTHE